MVSVYSICRFRYNFPIPGMVARVFLNTAGAERGFHWGGELERSLMDPHWSRRDVFKGLFAASAAIIVPEAGGGEDAPVSGAKSKYKSLLSAILFG